MADQEQVRRDTQQQPRDNEVVDPLVVMGWDHRGQLCMNPAVPPEHMPDAPTLAGMLRRLAQVVERQIIYVKPKVEPEIVLARGKLPPFPGQNGRH